MACEPSCRPVPQKPQAIKSLFVRYIFLIRFQLPVKLMQHESAGLTGWDHRIHDPRLGATGRKAWTSTSQVPDVMTKGVIDVGLCWRAVSCCL